MARKIKWNTEKINTLRQLAEEQLNVVEIAQTMNESASSIQHQLTKHKITTINSPEHWNKQDINILMECINSNKTMIEITKLFPKRNRNSIYVKIKSLGFDPINRIIKPWTEIETNKLIELHKENRDCYEMAKILNKKPTTIFNKCHILKLPFSNKRRNKKENFKFGDISGSKFSKIKLNAKKRDFEFKITIEYSWELFLTQERKCALSGVLLNMSTASLDRIDSSKGYIKGNIQWVHKDLNQMKMNMDEKDFFRWVKIIYEHKNPH